MAWEPGLPGPSDAPDPDHYGQNCITLANGAGEDVYIINSVLPKALHCGVKEMGYGGNHFVIEGNVIFDNGEDARRDHGIYVPSSNAVIRGNAVFRSASYGIHLYSKPQRIHVYNNVCFGNTKDGILQAGGYGVIAHNVVVRSRADIKLFRSNCTYNQFKNNITFDNDYCEMGLDDGGGKYLVPKTNTISYGVAYPSSDWYLPSLLMSMNGCSIWPDPGIFPAIQYSEPSW
ncbi:MAG: right-handed parallel beta-helix repeat-containing protein [Armatimonadetes bacterium]|nr:right-handed parallel beta-helix repeat-containing protein [Armatimonadota bacterium]